MINARALAGWSAACLVVALVATNPVYRALVLAAGLAVVLAGAGLAASRRLLFGVGVAAFLATLFSFSFSHLGTDVLFRLPDGVPGLGGPFTLEALAFGATAGLTLSAAVLSVAPLGLLLEPHQVVDALPPGLSRTGAALAASLNLVPSVARGFTAVADAQRMRGWRPGGPRSWAEIVVPVVLTSIEDSIQLAEAMEARGFGSGPRTHFRPPSWSRADTLVALTALAAATLFLAARLAGWAGDWYAYPALRLPDLNAVPAAACLLLFAPVLAWRWRASRA